MIILMVLLLLPMIMIITMIISNIVAHLCLSSMHLKQSVWAMLLRIIRCIQDNIYQHWTISSQLRSFVLRDCSNKYWMHLSQTRRATTFHAAHTCLARWASPSRALPSLERNKHYIHLSFYISLSMYICMCVYIYIYIIILRYIFRLHTSQTRWGNKIHVRRRAHNEREGNICSVESSATVLCGFGVPVSRFVTFLWRTSVSMYQHVPCQDLLGAQFLGCPLISYVQPLNNIYHQRLAQQMTW